MNEKYKVLIGFNQDLPDGNSLRFEIGDEVEEIAGANLSDLVKQGVLGKLEPATPKKKVKDD